MQFLRLNFNELEEYCPIDIEEIVKKSFIFARCASFTKSDVYIMIKNALEAKQALDSSRLFIKTLIEPEENNYIREHLNSFIWLNENLGRYDRNFMDIWETQLRQLENLNNLLNTTNSKNAVRLKVDAFLRNMLIAIEHLVYYPLLRASERFYGKTEITKEGKAIMKDRELFIYFVFLYLFHASESLGAWTRDEKKNDKIMTGYEDKIPPNLPNNVRTYESQDIARVAEKYLQEINTEHEYF